VSKQKFYVVWNGVKPGIYKTWRECELQIKGFQDARYKSFKTLAEAEHAYQNGYIKSIRQHADKKPVTKTSSPVIKYAIVVDAACSSSTWDMEYRGIQYWDGKELFLMGPYRDGTNNIGEFLAIVHALALLKQNNSDLPVYSDSNTAIGWVLKKKANTKVQPTAHNKPLLELLHRAEKWLNDNTYPNKILKWETESWGENPADFGRK
jgi:ribonuclease HI